MKGTFFDYLRLELLCETTTTVGYRVMVITHSQFSSELNIYFFFTYFSQVPKITLRNNVRSQKENDCEGELGDRTAAAWYKFKYATRITKLQCVLHTSDHVGSTAASMHERSTHFSHGPCFAVAA